MYSEGSTVWEANWQIRKHSDCAIGIRRLERQIVRYLVDGEEQVLICRCSDDIGCQEELPGEEGSFFDEVGAEYLE